MLLLQYCLKISDNILKIKREKSNRDKTRKLHLYVNQLLKYTITFNKKISENARSRQFSSIKPLTLARNERARKIQTHARESRLHGHAMRQDERKLE